MTQRALANRSTATFGIGLLIASLLLASPQAVAGSGEIALHILNSSQQPLRCVAVLAHFVTRDLPAIAANSSITIHLGRDESDGSLSYGHHGDKPLLLENLLCGQVSDWTASRQDVPLQSLRSNPAQSFGITCRGDGTAPLLCAAPTAP